MSSLNATLRNDYLRITILENHASADRLNQLQTDFVELLQATACSEVVIVNLPSVDQLEPELIHMLLTWHRIASLAGRKFRMNGVSHVLTQILQQMTATPPMNQSGPHRTRSYAKVPA